MDTDFIQQQEAEERAERLQWETRDRQLKLIAEIATTPQWQALLNVLAPALEPRPVQVIQDGNHAIQLASALAWQSGARHVVQIVDDAVAYSHRPQEFDQ